MDRPCDFKPAPGAPAPTADYLALATREPLWVFGYGSLMWDPGFPHDDQASALLYGYHRRFCIYSMRYRGTPERPGLVLGLDRGGACRGMAYRIGAADAPEVLHYLWRREMITMVYTPRLVTVRLEAGRETALTFVANPGHRQYHASRCPQQAAALIRQGVGARGPNDDYLRRTLAHLEELQIRDTGLGRILGLVDRQGAAGGAVV